MTSWIVDYASSTRNNSPLVEYSTNCLKYNLRAIGYRQGVQATTASLGAPNGAMLAIAVLPRHPSWTGLLVASLWKLAGHHALWHHEI